jgi:hypothetical protein
MHALYMRHQVIRCAPTAAIDDLLSCGNSGFTANYDLEGGSLLQRLCPVMHGAWLTDEHRAISLLCRSDFTANLYDLERGSLLQRLAGHAGDVWVSCAWKGEDGR